MDLHTDCHNVNDTTHKYQSGKRDPGCFSFDVIFSKYYNALIRFAIGFKIQSEIAEELAADSMVKLWQRFDKFEHHLQMKSFLYTSVRFACLNLLRDTKRKPVVATTDHLDPCSPEDNVSQSLVKTEIRREVRLGITTLPPQCKSVVESVFLLELDSKQIASELNIAVSTVRNQKARGLKLLRSRIKL